MLGLRGEALNSEHLFTVITTSRSRSSSRSILYRFRLLIPLLSCSTTHITLWLSKRIEEKEAMLQIIRANVDMPELGIG